MSRLTQAYGERAVALLLAAAIAARADVDDNHNLREALCEKIGDHLRELHHRGDYSGQELNAAFELRERLYREWPEWSGSSGYPVPAPEEDRDLIDELREDNCLDAVDWDDSYDSAAAYFDAVEDSWLYEGNMYDESSDYGLSRRRLLSFLIDELTKESVNA